MQERAIIGFPCDLSEVQDDDGMAVFKNMALWCDPYRRSGPETMAVDEWLLETCQIPTLRIYGWKGNWGSIGYFGKIHDARDAIPEIHWVRRLTGGGIVDHRSDWTYTLVAPAGAGFSKSRGTESYRLIHAALSMALVEEGIDARLSSGAQQTGESLCFRNPVGHDVVDETGRKLAGAGQRRTKCGFLHQGSVALACSQAGLNTRAERLANALADQWRPISIEVPMSLIQRKLRERYAAAGWTQRC
jgi:lipoate-protein ligase A